MSAAPAGVVVKIHIDSPDTIEPGHVVQTTTGRRYLVKHVRRQERGKYAGRWHLRCEVMDRTMKVREWVATTFHYITWYPRIPAG